MSESALVVLSGVAADVQQRVFSQLSAAGYGVRTAEPGPETPGVVSLAAQVTEIVRRCLAGQTPTALLVVEPGNSAAAKLLTFPLLTILVDRRDTLVDGAPVALSKGEFNLLRLVASYPGRG